MHQHHQLSAHGAVAAVLACGLAGPALLGAQSLRAADRTGPAPAVEAAERALRDARRAQARFESARRRLVPEVDAAVGRCDQHIGRFCYWYDDVPAGPDEPRRVGQARAELLHQLDVAAATAPEMPWVLGQRVRYRVEAGQADSALAALGTCAAGDWWCSALRGYALHAATRDVEAQGAFDAALTSMPAEQRCRWQDITLLLDDDARRVYAPLPCGAERERFERQYWWLARPLWSRPGDDRRNEHFARMALSRMLEDARTPHGLRWAADMHEMGVRYGWPVRWSRRATRLLSEPMTVVGHEAVPSYEFGASLHALQHPDSAGPEDWRLSEPLARSRYAPAYARRFAPLAAQVTVFRRGDSLLVVAASALPDSSADDSLALALSASADDSLRVAPLPAPGAPRVRALLAPAPAGAYLASVESTSDSTLARRLRLAVRAPPVAGALGVSDLLLFAAEDSAGGEAMSPAPPATLEAALPLALGDVVVSTPGEVGVYWEVYGLPPGRPRVRFSLSLTGDRPGWLARVGERLRREPRRRPVLLQWEDAPMVNGNVTARSVTVQLPRLPDGAYKLQLRVTSPDGGRVVAERGLNIVRR